MNYLLDTCAFLDCLIEPSKLTQKARSVIEDGNNAVFVSAITGNEIKMLKNLERLILHFDDFLAVEEYGFDHLPFKYDHAIALDGLPLHHRDPFDRMLIAQAMSENLTIITSDRKFPLYPVEVMPY